MYFGRFLFNTTLKSSFLSDLKVYTQAYIFKSSRCTPESLYLTGYYALNCCFLHTPIVRWLSNFVKKRTCHD